MSKKLLIGLDAFRDAERLDDLFWIEHCFEVVDDIDDGCTAKCAERKVVPGCQKAANDNACCKRAQYVYGQGTSNSFNRLH